MNIDLNRYQRIVLLSAAALILIVQFAQFTDNHGVKGAGWIFSFLVAGLLVLVALSKPKPIGFRGREIAMHTSNEEAARVSAGLRESAEVLAVEVEQRAKAIADSLIIEKDAMVLGIVHTVHGSREQGDKFVQIIDKHIRQFCLFLMLGLVGMRRANGNKMYITGIEFKHLQELITAKIMETAVSSQRSLPIPVEVNPQALSHSVLADIQDIRRTITSYCIAIESGISEPEGSLLDWFESKCMKVRGNPHLSQALRENRSLETPKNAADEIVPVTIAQCGDLLAAWLEKNSDPQLVKQFIKETGYDDSSESKKIRIVGEIAMLNSALAIFAVNQIFLSTEAEAVIDSYLSVARRSVFRLLEDRDPTFKKRYQQRLRKYFEILAEEKPALGMSFALLQNLGVDPVKSGNAQIVVSVRLGNSLKQTIDALKRLKLVNTATNG